MTSTSNATRADKAAEVIATFGGDLCESNLIDFLADFLH